jgi:large subunit ribosomal protein L21
MVDEMRALFKLGGNQYLAGEGDVFMSHRVSADVGETIASDDVLSLIDGDATIVGNPAVNGASVELKVLNHGRAKKVIIQKYRSKTNYRIRKGHKQGRSQLQLLKIHPGK